MVSYAYIHCKPDGTPFYVGKGALRRAKYLGERNQYHQATVNKYGKDNILIGMLECSTDKIALALEVGIIKCMKRSGVKLTNFTDGGEGTVNPTPESRKRMSDAAKKRGVSEACHAARVVAKTGKPISDEQKARQSAAMTGKRFTEEHKRNISASAKKRGMSQAVLDAAKEASTGRKQTVEEKNKRSESMKLFWDLKGRKQKIEKQKGNCWDSRKTRSVYVDGVFFKTMKQAASYIGVSSGAVLYALKKTGYTKGRKVTEHIDDN